MMNGGMMNVGMVMYMILLILVFGFIIYGILSLITKLFNKERVSSSESGRSLQILRERFARGELSEEEFELKRSFLKNEN